MIRRERRKRRTECASSKIAIRYCCGVIDGHKIVGVGTIPGITGSGLREYPGRDCRVVKYGSSGRFPYSQNQVGKLCASFS